MAQERENIWAGLFVLLGIALALVVVFTLADFDQLFAKQQTIKVSYRVADGLMGLKEGATVTIGDQPIGEVTAIKDAPADAEGRIVEQIVSFTIPQRYKIFKDAVVELNAPPLGSGTKLNIKSVGSKTAYDGLPLEGKQAGSPLTRNLARDAGIGDRQREQIGQIIDNVTNITTELRGNLPKIMSSIQTALDKAQPVVEGAGGAVADLQTALRDTKELVAEVRKRSEQWMDNIDTITNKGGSSLTRVDKLLEDKDPDIRKAVDNVRDITQQAKDKTMVQVTELLDRANVSVENVKKSTEELRAFATGQRPVLERLMANLQLSSDQLKLATVEIRRSPWRLLYTPEEKELETDNLYDAARSFALAAGTLDAATQSLQAVVQKNPENKEKIEKMVEHLEALFKRFDEAETEFWKQLKRSPGPGTSSR
ncbi:MAG: hypothetical protein IT444_05655 [Phycisphaeraceae bacterium]|nr:hypothetical protein [Phycisphaeraceae bacterium]